MSRIRFLAGRSRFPPIQFNFPLQFSTPTKTCLACICKARIHVVTKRICGRCYRKEIKRCATPTHSPPARKPTAIQNTVYIPISHRTHPCLYAGSVIVIIILSAIICSNFGFGLEAYVRDVSIVTKRINVAHTSAVGLTCLVTNSGQV